ncbi:MAG: Crp/Fnr family transcriptional regulator [Rhizobiaceae bacterium]
MQNGRLPFQVVCVRRDIHSDGVPVLCLACEARHNGICGALQPNQLVQLAKSTSKKKVEAGTHLIEEAGAIERYANILSGVVKLSKTLPDGRQQIVGLQFAPDFLGRPFENESRLRAEAATNVSLCSFPRSALERVMDESPELERRLLKQTLKELDDARDWMLTLGRKTASEKVASFLVLIARNIDPYAERDRTTASFDLPLTRGEIADFLGLTLETVSRQLTKLRTEGVIEMEGVRRVTIPDLERLAIRAG